MKIQLPALGLEKMAFGPVVPILPIPCSVGAAALLYHGGVSQAVLTQITGGAGFVGSHLTDKLMMDGHEVTVVDNFFTGRKRNVEHWIGHENFELINHDVVEPLYIEGEPPSGCPHAGHTGGRARWGPRVTI